MDWDEFRSLAGRGYAGGDRGLLRAALALVRGQPPLAGLDYWWLDPFFTETVRAAVAGTAVLLAGLELAAGDPAAARDAARAGLAAGTDDEQLWRLLMRAEDAAGNTAGVHAAWRGCLAAIAGIAPGAGPHPDTAALYRDLTGHRPAAAPRPSPPAGRAARRPGRAVPGRGAAGSRHGQRAMTGHSRARPGRPPGAGRPGRAPAGAAQRAGGRGSAAGRGVRAGARRGAGAGQAAASRSWRWPGRWRPGR